MFKKIISAIAIILIATAPVFAGGMGEYSAAGNSYDQSQFSWGNEAYGSNAGSGGSAYNQNWFNVNNGAQAGVAHVDGQSKASGFIWDSGYTSFSKAGAATEVQANAAGAAFGAKLFAPTTTYSQSNVAIGGSANQGNQANEVGYSGANAYGGNKSSAGFEGSAGMTMQNTWWPASASASSANLQGAANTNGSTFVTVDPNGNHRSAYGITTNETCSSIAGGPNAQTATHVEGQGSINTNAQVGSYSPNNASAAAFSGFKYDATNYGGGYNALSGTGTASNFSDVQKYSTCSGCNGFSATAGGYSTTQVAPTQFCSGPSCGR